MKWAAVGLCALVFLGGCKRPARPTRSYSAQIKALESANPAVDVDRAILAGDWRFVGVMSDGPIVPGAPAWVRLSPPGQVKYIPNTSDAIESEEHGRLQRVAYRYAERYNQILLRKVPSLATTQPASGSPASMNTTMPSR